ncbi:MAG: MarR family winged helix-turn-helix transcriptional regulator [Terriglobales bacterium]
MRKQLTITDYRALAEMRYQVRRFLHFSEQASRNRGLEPRQHQLLLALKGLQNDVQPTIGELAKRLLIQHHSAVELVNRLAARGYVRRQRGELDRREIHLSLTAKGARILGALSLHHQSELLTEGPALLAALKQVIYPAGSTHAKGEMVSHQSSGKTKKGNR